MKIKKSAGIALGVAVALFFLYGFVTTFVEAQDRSLYGRSIADVRSLATAIERYKADTGVHPPAPDQRLDDSALELSGGPIFDMHKPQRESFRGFHFYAAQQDTEWKWLLQAVGPNGKRDLQDLSILDGLGAGMERELDLYRYDPTNGTYSRGDLFRLGQ